MLNPEKQPEPPLGEQCLQVLGYGHLIGTEVSYVTAEGTTQTIAAQDFLDVCGVKALPTFKLLMKLDQQNPDHEKYFDGARTMLESRLSISRELG